MSPNVQAALRRPRDYRKLSAREQWNIDASLGILDWDPTPEERKEYEKAYKEREASNGKVAEGQDS